MFDKIWYFWYYFAILATYWLFLQFLTPHYTAYLQWYQSCKAVGFLKMGLIFVVSNANNLKSNQKKILTIDKARILRKSEFKLYKPLAIMECIRYIKLVY